MSDVLSDRLYSLSPSPPRKRIRRERSFPDYFLPYNIKTLPLANDDRAKSPYTAPPSPRILSADGPEESRDVVAFNISACAQHLPAVEKATSTDCPVQSQAQAVDSSLPTAHTGTTNTDAEKLMLGDAWKRVFRLAEESQEWFYWETMPHQLTQLVEDMQDGFGLFGAGEESGFWLDSWRSTVVFKASKPEGYYMVEATNMEKAWPITQHDPEELERLLMNTMTCEEKNVLWSKELECLWGASDDC